MRQRVMAFAVLSIFLVWGLSPAVAAEKAKAAAEKDAAKDAVQAEKQATKETRKIKTIFDYKTDLNITDDQEGKIRETLSALEKDVKVLRAKLTLVEVDAQGLLEKEGDMNQLKAKIKEAYDIQASMRIADIEAARKINSILSAQQLKKWKEIQASARKK